MIGERGKKIKPIFLFGILESPKTMLDLPRTMKRRYLLQISIISIVSDLFCYYNSVSAAKYKKIENRVLISNFISLEYKRFHFISNTVV